MNIAKIILNIIIIGFLFGCATPGAEVGLSETCDTTIKVVKQCKDIN